MHVNVIWEPILALSRSEGSVKFQHHFMIVFKGLREIVNKITLSYSIFKCSGSLTNLYRIFMILLLMTEIIDFKIGDGHDTMD